MARQDGLDNDPSRWSALTHGVHAPSSAILRLHARGLRAALSIIVVRFSRLRLLLTSIGPAGPGHPCRRVFPRFGLRSRCFQKKTAPDNRAALRWHISRAALPGAMLKFLGYSPMPPRAKVRRRGRPIEVLARLDVRARAPPSMPRVLRSGRRARGRNGGRGAGLSTSHVDPALRGFSLFLHGRRTGWNDPACFGPPGAPLPFGYRPARGTATHPSRWPGSRGH